jgi:hypothetical protein
MVEMSAAWKDYIVKVRNGEDTFDVLYANAPASRNWNSERWRIGFDNVFVNRPDVIDLNEDESEEE